MLDLTNMNYNILNDINNIIESEKFDIESVTGTAFFEDTRM